ncbi:MAG: alpha/beta fold hydrolase [Acidimicrobiales bacterium]|nr:alpha/beta fold hydrolase [Acidimicrobiales bacterium]
MKRVLVVLVVLATLMTALVTAPAAGASDRSSPRPGRAPAEELGPWAIGYETFELVDAARGDRTLPVDVWYPVDADDAVGVPKAQLDLFVADYELEYALDAPEPAGKGRFPLVVFSHGSGGFRSQSWFYMQHLASHGYVVVAPDHVGNTALDGFFGTQIPGSEMVTLRPQDISFVMDEILAMNEDDDHRYDNLINERRIAVAGHSFGGYTALAIAGGVEALGLEADERVDAIIPLAGASNGMSDVDLENIDIPTLFLSSTDDVTVPLDPGTVRPFDLISSRRAYRVDILSGGHNSFVNICDLVDVLLEAGLPDVLLAQLISSAEEGCGADLINIDEAHRLTNLYSVAFLNDVFNRPGRNARYLTDDYAEANELPVDLYDLRRGEPRLRFSGVDPVGPLRDFRYCEMITLAGLPNADGLIEATVWNSMFLNDCPQDAFDAIDTAEVAADLGVTAAVKNGPRYWVLDAIAAEGATAGGEIYDFGGIEMRSSATVLVNPANRAPYSQTSVERDTVFSFFAGREVPILTDPHGNEYVMQSYSLEVDPELGLADVTEIGGDLGLPPGWTFEARFLDQQLDVVDQDGIATVVQDDLRNTYQLIAPA